MEFEWDEVKNQANIRKHGVGFDTAKRIFDGPVVNWTDQRKDYSEDRSISIGRVEKGGADRGCPYRSGRAHSLNFRPSSVPQGKADLP